MERQSAIGGLVALILFATALLAIVLFVSLDFEHQMNLAYGLLGALLLANAAAVLLLVSNLLRGSNDDVLKESRTFTSSTSSSSISGNEANRAEDVARGASSRSPVATTD
jgi:hypothetical protein